MHQRTDRCSHFSRPALPFGVRCPANSLQGLRDYFGAHTYCRIDRDGSFHIRWP
jgi:hypothetical protein